MVSDLVECLISYYVKLYSGFMKIYFYNKILSF